MDFNTMCFVELVTEKSLTCINLLISNVVKIRRNRQA